MYTPLKPIRKETKRRFNSTTPSKGENGRQFSALLKPEQAIRIINYLPDSEGKLFKRRGLSKIWEVAGDVPVTLLKRFTSNVWIFGYGTTIASYNETTKAVTTIKSTFSVNLGFDGVRYGDYFFVCNGVEKIWRIETSLAISEVAASPICSKLAVYQARLFAGNLSTDATAVAYAALDEGANPPFTNWTVGTLATNAGQVNYRNAGPVRDIVSLGTNIIVFADYGKWAFSINQQDIGGAIKKIDQVVMDRTDLGGSAALVTKKGVFYVNEAGVWQLTSIGQPNIPFSEQEFTVSYILGREYFVNLDLTKASLAFDNINDTLLVSCAEGTVSNNKVIVYNLVNKAFSQIQNWPVRKFYMDNDSSIWAASSVSTKVYKCFVGSTDDGAAIGTQYYQEMNVGDFNNLKTLEKFMVQADLSPSTVLTISFDVFDRNAVFQENVESYNMVARDIGSSLVGYGKAKYGSPYGSAGSPDDGTIPTYDSYKPMYPNIQRLFVKITSGDKVPHTVNMFMAELDEKSPIRVRNITPS